MRKIEKNRIKGKFFFLFSFSSTQNSLRKLDEGVIIDPSSLSYLDKYVRKKTENTPIQQQTEEEELEEEAEGDEPETIEGTIGDAENNHESNEPNPDLILVEKEVDEQLLHLKLNMENLFTKEDELISKAEDIINPKRKK